MTQKRSKGKDAEESAGRTGTYGFAPLGYVELAGMREALQKATHQITVLEKENEILRKRLKEAEAGLMEARTREGWDYSHLGETEKAVIEAFIRGDFSTLGLQETCAKLAREHGRKVSTYRKVFAKLRDYGVLSRLSPEES